MPLPFERQPNRRQTAPIMAHHGPIDRAALLLLAISGLNWAVIALFDFDAVVVVLEEGTYFARTVHFAFGAAAIRCLLLITRSPTD